MKISRVRYIIVVFAAVLMMGAVSVFAQAAPDSSKAAVAADTVGSLPGIEIETSVDKAEIYIGDLVTYQVAIRYDTTAYTLIPPPLGANLGAFDVKDYQPDLVKKLDGNRVESRTIFVLSTFTTGDYTIPALPVIFELPDGSRKLLLAEPVPIAVKSLLENASDSVDIKPLKPQYAFKRDYTAYYLYGGLGLLLLFILLAVWLILSRRKKAAEMEDNRPPWEKAFEKLAYLQQEDLAGKEEYKEFYVRLTEIARWYLEKMYVSDVLEMTTEQFVEAFVGRDLPEGLYDELVACFRHADMVKFAKYTPDRKRVASDFDFVHSMIETVRTEFERRMQQEVQMKKARGGNIETEADKISETSESEEVSK